VTTEWKKLKMPCSDMPCISSNASWMEVTHFFQRIMGVDDEGGGSKCPV
jgi:hypothetical protein